MLLVGFERIETEFFRGLNRFVEPIVRAGLVAPGIFPATAIVVETHGRKSGLPLNVPLVAAVFGDLVVVATIRKRSNWIKNLAAHPEIRYWLGGREKSATAFAIAPGIESPEIFPERVSCLANALKQHSATFGTGFAILMPHHLRSRPGSASDKRVI